MRPKPAIRQGNGFPLNQNRNQNRRRGRGSHRGQGGGNQGNRIDSRARGNAPQLLEKYKKLAHDASLNGDRVQTEYYLQFADHYFRVVADSRAQREEQRPRRDNDRDQDREQSFDDSEDFEDQDDGSRGRRSRDQRERDQDDEPRAEEGERGSEGETLAAEDNPFTRESRNRRPRARGRSRSGGDEPAENGSADEAGLDANVLPPSIAREEETKPRQTRSRTRRSRPADDGGEEALEAVS